MSKIFRETLPAEFVRNTIALCGDRGDQWLKKLPELIRDLEDQWSLTVYEHFPNIGYNFVAAATRADGSPAVIKIGLPLENIEIFSEAKYLRTLKGSGAVVLLEEDRQVQAILLERALPGETLTRVFEDREGEAIRPAIEVLQLALRPVPTDLSDSISLDAWFSGLRRFSEKSFPAKYGEKALQIYDRLSTQPGKTYYLHGDFHPDNIVSAKRASFLLIDPKGIIGHVGYEIAVFLNNFHWWQDESADIEQRLESAVNGFAAAFSLDPTELREWAFAQMVLSAWWTFDEMPKLYDNEVAKADIWGV